MTRPQAARLSLVAVGTVAYATAVAALSAAIVAVLPTANAGEAAWSVAAAGGVAASAWALADTVQDERDRRRKHVNGMLKRASYREVRHEAQRLLRQLGNLVVGVFLLLTPSASGTREITPAGAVVAGVFIFKVVMDLIGLVLDRIDRRNLIAGARAR